MPEALPHKPKLINRVRRIAGQVDAIERALEDDRSCTDLLNLIVSARGAMNALMAEVLEEHVRSHVLGAAPKNSPRRKATDELVELIRAYLR